MADYQVAFNYLLDDEDRGRSGAVVPDPTQSDPKAVARFGINSYWTPEAKAEGFYDMSNDQALAWVENFYKYRFFAGIGGYSIACQDIANKFLSLAVNEGLNQATKIVQRACNQILTPVAIGYLPLTIDGIAGQKTTEAINAAPPEQLLPAIKAYACQFYKDVAFREKWPARKLSDLLTRANR